MPVVTVADCMPLYLYNPSTKVFGLVHSGWKGTGIIGHAIKKALENFGGNIKDFHVVLGPHIRSCCYIVNKERADYFAENFTAECVSPLEENGKCYAGKRGLSIPWYNGEGELYRLSLEKANLACILKLGIPEENITLIKDCTCCNTIFGSNRRETAEAISENGKNYTELVKNSSFIPPFTVQSAFIRF